MNKEDGSAIVQNPRIVIEFQGDGSSVADWSITGCNFMQLFAAAKLIGFYGEEVYAAQRMKQLQTQANQKKVVPFHGNLPKGN